MSQERCSHSEEKAIQTVLFSGAHKSTQTEEMKSCKILIAKASTEALLPVEKSMAKISIAKDSKNESIEISAKLNVLAAFHSRKPPHLWNTAIFFTPNPDGEADSTEKINKVMYYFENAKMSIQIALFLASLKRFEHILIQKKAEGKIVQILTDKDTMDVHNNFCFLACIRAGIPVCINSTGYLMHNKFAIIDQEAVVTGSLNITNQALSKNMENIVVSTDPGIVSKYVEEYSNLMTGAVRYKY